MSEFKIRSVALPTVGLLALLAAGPSVAKVVEIDLPGPGDFSTYIDNAYWPLLVGTSFAYRAETEDGCEFNKLTVIGDIYTVALGYDTQVIRDQAWEADDCLGTNVHLVEDTKDYYAQSGSGIVYYFGEETYSLPDEGEGPACSSEGSWEAGVVGEAGNPAEPGIIMLAEPESGDRYQQEYLEDEAEDWGAVTQVGAKVDIDFGEYPDCVKTREWTPLEPGHVEHKFYCPFEGENPGPAGLMFIEELKGKTVNVEYIGSDFGAIGPLPGEDDVPLPDTFPSDDMDCTP